MRCLRRNQRSIWFATFREGEPIIDAYGNDTGQHRIEYSKPIPLRANISPATGEVLLRQFGNTLDYDEVLVIEDLDTKLDESSVLWIDVKPVLNRDGTTATPYDHIVKRVSRSLNHVTVAVKKVKVGA